MEVGIPVHFNFDGDAMLLELQVTAMTKTYKDNLERFLLNYCWLIGETQRLV